MIVLAAALLGAAAALLPGPTVRGPRPRTTWSPPIRPVAVAVAIYVVVGGRWGLILGVVGGVVAGRGAATRRAEADESWSGAAPVMVELMAAAVRAGVPPVLAVAEAAGALGAGDADGLTRLLERWRYGLSARELPLDAPSRLVARAVEQAHDSGAAPATALEHAARDLAADAGMRAQERARRVGVQAAIPLGVCLLPAFLLLGVVPLVASLMAGLAG